MKFFCAVILGFCVLVSCGTREAGVGDDGGVVAITYYSKHQLDSELVKALRDKTVLRILGQSQEDEEYMIIIRTAPGQVEVHEQWDDIVVVRSGHATLRTGRQDTINMKETGERPWRNWFGTSIKNAAEQRLGPGDFIIIPALTAHQYVPDTGDTLTYWTIKVKRERTMEY